MCCYCKICEGSVQTKSDAGIQTDTQELETSGAIAGTEGRPTSPSTVGTSRTPQSSVPIPTSLPPLVVQAAVDRLLPGCVFDWDDPKMLAATYHRLAGDMMQKMDRRSQETIALTARIGLIEGFMARVCRNPEVALFTQRQCSGSGIALTKCHTQGIFEHNFVAVLVRAVSTPCFVLQQTPYLTARHPGPRCRNRSRPRSLEFASQKHPTRHVLLLALLRLCHGTVQPRSRCYSHCLACLQRP
jgi:hypothetical protein